MSTAVYSLDDQQKLPSLSQIMPGQQPQQSLYLLPQPLLAYVNQVPAAMPSVPAMAPAPMAAPAATAMAPSLLMGSAPQPSSSSASSSSLLSLLLTTPPIPGQYGQYAPQPPLTLLLMLSQGGYAGDYPQYPYQQQYPQFAPAQYPQPPPQPPLDKCICKLTANRIPRPRNAFILFRQKYHQLVLDEGLVIRTNPEVSRELGRRWRALLADEKDHWNLLAEEEKKNHAKKYPGYRYTPRRNGKLKNCPACRRQAMRPAPAPAVPVVDFPYQGPQPEVYMQALLFGSYPPPLFELGQHTPQYQDKLLPLLGLLQALPPAGSVGEYPQPQFEPPAAGPVRFNLLPTPNYFDGGFQS